MTNREQHRAYNRSAKGRARSARYWQTPKGRANRLRATCASRVAHIQLYEEGLR